MGIDELPLTRDREGRLRMAGYGPVHLRIDYQHIIATEPEGVVFKGYITGRNGCLAKEVALKLHKEVKDPLRQLRHEAEMHVHAWVKLGHVLSPLGFLAAYDVTGMPAMFATEIGMPLVCFLDLAGPVWRRTEIISKAVARVTHQLLRHIVGGDVILFMHKDINVHNIYVTKTHRLELAELAMGGFRSAQRGQVNEDGSVSYRTGVYSWNQTSPRMASIVYERMAMEKKEREDIALERQLTLYNDLFAWARIAFMALTDRESPDILYGPRAEDYAQVPEEGSGGVLDAIRHILVFALQLMTTGVLDEEVNSEYVQGLDWYDELIAALDVKPPPG